jgi:hypothetical protein
MANIKFGMEHIGKLVENGTFVPPAGGAMKKKSYV